MERSLVSEPDRKVKPNCRASGPFPDCGRPVGSHPARVSYHRATGIGILMPSVPDPRKPLPSMDRRVLYLGGNGHSSARLGPARSALARLTAAGDIRPFHLLDVPYPGFENRPRAPNLDAFLDDLSGHLAALRAPPDGRTLLYGTGIGGLLHSATDGLRPGRIRSTGLRVPAQLPASASTAGTDLQHKSGVVTAAGEVLTFSKHGTFGTPARSGHGRDARRQLSPKLAASRPGPRTSSSAEPS
jgi:hypothetical protein